MNVRIVHTDGSSTVLKPGDPEHHYWVKEVEHSRDFTVKSARARDRADMVTRCMFILFTGLLAAAAFFALRSLP